MPTRIGINGLGRMGRLALRAGWGRPDLQFVHVNEVSGGPGTAAHLLTFDSGDGDRFHLPGAPRPIVWHRHSGNMANACGRLLGTLLSGVLYQQAGVSASLWGAVALAAAAGIGAVFLPPASAPALSWAGAKGDDEP